jgi:hypothetical protein
MWSFIKSFFITEETQSITPNSMSPLPHKKFINYARAKGDVYECDAPHRDYHHYKRMERLATKRYNARKRERRKKTQDWYEYFNH